MSKYKLIKKYPGSPELGTIAERGCGIEFTLPNGKKEGTCYSNGKDNFKILIEDNPEFWEEVVEKDYEILSFVNNGTTGGKKGFIAPLQNDGLYYAKGYTRSDLNPTLETCLELPYLDIHSVKRLSDDEVFTVGDDIIVGSNNRRKLHSFVLNKDKILVCDNISINNARWCLSNIRKNNPLFTTEDGVDIYQGDKFYFISKTFNNLKCAIENYAHNGYWKHDDMKTFSTKEAAEEYILMNKPCLSFNDVNNIFSNYKGNFREGLKELVKSKL